MCQERRYPEYFPKGCPPNDAKHKELTVYRCCHDDTITSADFVSYYLLDPTKYCGQINAYGLSVFTNCKNLKEAMKLPYMKKNFKRIAVGATYANTGAIKPTPSKSDASHHTWWLYEGVEPHTFFILCK